MAGFMHTAFAGTDCKGTIYLTFDTGSQSQAEFIAKTLHDQHIQATFFLANEKTVKGDYSLDPGWAPYWRSLVQQGHAFGTHTFDHVYAVRDLPNGHVQVKPQFGAQAGKLLDWSPQQYCEEMKRVDQRSRRQTHSQSAKSRASLRLCACGLGAGRILRR